MIKMTNKQVLFVQEYMIDLNATQAAIRAGYSAKTAEWQGPQLLGKPHVALAIRERMIERAERTAIDQDYVLKTIQETIERCRQALPVLDRKGKQVIVETPDGQRAAAFTFDARSVLKGCELLGRHLGIFNDKLNVGISVGDVLSAFPEPVQKQIREALLKRLN